MPAFKQFLPAIVSGILLFVLHYLLFSNPIYSHNECSIEWGRALCICVLCIYKCVCVCVCIRLFITLKDWMDSPESPQKTTKALGLRCFVLLRPAASCLFSFPTSFHCCFSPTSCCCCCCCVCGKLSLGSPIMVHSHVNRNAFQFI